MSSAYQEVMTGTVEGTGSAINVSCGFLPSSVEVFNVDATAPVHMSWNSAMDAGHGLKHVAASTFTKVTSGGISQFTGSETAGAGFTIGIDSALNVSAETIFYRVYR